MDSVSELGRRAREAANHLAALITPVKDRVLRDLADRVLAAMPDLRVANERDLAAARAAGLAEAKLRRLALTDAAISQMAEGLRQVADLPDPVGAVTKDYRVPSGLHVRKVRTPLGVVMMIYEARPNVTIDAFALCFKAGNACILKGGREATHANQSLAALAGAALAAAGVTRDALTLIVSSDRDEMKRLLSLDQYIDLVIPRGGSELIRFVHEHSRIPTVQHFQGVCHIFVDATADLAKAAEICVTAKTSAPAACNAVETILVHADIAAEFLPQLAKRYAAVGVEMRCDPAARRIVPSAVAAADDDFGREFLDLIVAVAVVDDLDRAMTHIRRHTSNHTEAILTSDTANADRFVRELQSSCVLVNASTRFNDGFQLGLGAEIGISTSRIHAYGPMGLEELTTQRYVVHGSGQTR